MPSIRPFRGLALGLVLLLAAPGVAPARELQPLMRGWEQHFSVTWDTIQRHGRLEVEGYVNNRSPYRVGNVRVLVDSLDDAGRIVDQRVSWVLGELGATVGSTSKSQSRRPPTTAFASSPTIASTRPASCSPEAGDAAGRCRHGGTVASRHLTAPARP